MTATLEMPLIADPLAVLRGRGKRQDGFSYKLSTAEYGLDVILPEQLDIDENKMSVWIPFADGNRRDGVGDLLEVGGIRTDRHRSNPIVLFDHGKNVNLPIALAEEPETKAYSVVIDPITKSARANAYFYKGTGILGTNKGQEYEHALFCEQLFDLIAKRYIRAGSIGYQVIKALNLQPDYDTGAPQGLHLLVTLMLELSAVVLPANGDTVRKVLCMDGCCGKPLSPMLVKSLTPYASEEKVQIDSGIKAIPESSDKEIVAIPHGDMSKTDVPPVKWKPGLGAEKSKSIPGDLHWLNEEKKEDEHVKSSGEVRDGQASFYIRSIRNDSKQDYARSYAVWLESGGDPLSENGPGRSDLSYMAAQAVRDRLNKIYGKSLDRSRKALTLRKKYRTLKSLRRRVRKSIPGNSTMFVASKDVELARNAARKRGLKFHLLGSHGGNEKVRLSGDDKAIDELAKEFGKRMGKALEGYAPLWDVTGYGPIIPGNKYGDRVGFKTIRVMANDKESAIALALTILPDNRKEVPSAKKIVIQSIENWDGPKAPDIKAFNPSPFDPLHKGYLLVDHYNNPHMDLHDLKGELMRNGVDWGGYDVGLSIMVEDTPDAREILQERRLRFTRKRLTNGNKIKASKENSKMATKEIKRQIKAAPEDLPPVPDQPPVEESPVQEHEDLEPYGAQVLRRMHEDHSILLEEYDEMVQMLEHEGVKSHLTEVLEAIETLLTSTEELFSSEYADLPGLEGAVEEKDLEEEEEEKAEGEEEVEEEPMPEEAIEGMETKHLRQKRKELRKTYRKSNEDKEEKEKKSLKDDEKEDKKKSLKAKGDKEDKEKRLTKTVEDKDKEKKAMPEEMEQSDLDERERKMVGEASGFLKELSTTESHLYDDEKRMKSYHYGETMKGIGQLEEMAEEKDLKDEEKEEKDFEEIDKQEQAADIDELPPQKALHEHRQKCKAASDFFGELSTTKDFGDEHREQSKYWHHTLEPISKEEDEMGEMKTEEEILEPGDIDTKSIKQLKQVFSKQNKEVENLSGRLSHLLAKVI